GEVELEQLSDFSSLIGSLGAIPMVLTVEEHDFITAGVSHLPHIIASALVNLVSMLDNQAEYMKTIAAGGFRDITRIASSSPLMWQQICMENRENISNVLDDYIRLLIQIRYFIDNGKDQQLYQFFSNSRDYRDSIDVTHNGLLSKSHVLYLDIADEAGKIATIATILAMEQISIKNIGIIHNREFEQGVLKIEFYDSESLEQGKALLEKRNYIIYEP
ncbi:Prephenate dehydrogenase, partial [gut metagenome]